MKEEVCNKGCWKERFRKVVLNLMFFSDDNKKKPCLSTKASSYEIAINELIPSLTLKSYYCIRTTVSVEKFDKWEENNIWLTISFHNEWMFICIKKLFSFSSKQNSIVRNAIFYSQFNNLSLIYITICIKLSLTLQNMINRSFVRCKATNILIFSIAWNITFLWNFLSLCIIKRKIVSCWFFSRKTYQFSFTCPVLVLKYVNTFDLFATRIYFMGCLNRYLSVRFKQIWWIFLSNNVCFTSKCFLCISEISNLTFMYTKSFRRNMLLSIF